MSIYQKFIKETLKEMGCEQYDPRHIEAYIRIEHDTLDGLSSAMFRKEIELAIFCINSAGINAAERLAQSFGL